MSLLADNMWQHHGDQAKECMLAAINVLADESLSRRERAVAFRQAMTELAGHEAMLDLAASAQESPR